MRRHWRVKEVPDDDDDEDGRLAVSSSGRSTNSTSRTLLNVPSPLSLTTVDPEPT